MTRIVLTLTLTLLALSTFNAAAQDTDGWPVEQRCVGEPAAPPEGWTFEGTIFTQNQEGIRGVSSQIATHHFIIFDDGFASGAAPSPDGRWYAVPAGTIRNATMVDFWYIVTEIRVYSTDGRRELYSLPWNITYRGGDGSAVHRIRWLDNEHLLYERGEYQIWNQESFVANPFSGEVRRSDEDYAVAGQSSYPSPDGTRSVIRTPRDYVAAWALYDQTTSELIAELTSERVFHLEGAVVWTPDSLSFLARITNNTAEGGFHWGIASFDREGNLESMMYQSTNNAWIVELFLSRDGHYLAFIDNGHLYFADMREQRIFDLCLDIGLEEVAWSPYGTQLAFDNHGNIIVLDITTQQPYIVASNIGSVVGWGIAD